MGRKNKAHSSSVLSIDFGLFRDAADASAYRAQYGVRNYGFRIGTLPFGAHL